MSIIRDLVKGAEESYYSSRLKARGVILFLTYRCTSKCTACNIWKRPKSYCRELSWEEWQPVLEKIAQSDIKSIEFFGGDVLLKKELLIKMINFCKENNIKTYMPINSNLMDDKTAREIVAAGLDTIYISLDEMPSIKGSIRGVNKHFEKVEHSIQLIKKYRGTAKTPTMVCITTISKHNYNLLDDFIDYVNSVPFDCHMLRGLSEFSVSMVQQSKVGGVYPDPIFMSSDNVSHLLTEPEAEQFLKKLDLIQRNSRRGYSIPVDTEGLDFLTAKDMAAGLYPNISCLFMTTQMVLTPAAEVLPCYHFSRNILGDLTKQSIEEVWGNKAHKEFCRMQKHGRLTLCDSCSIKIYHKPFKRVSIDVSNRVYQKIRDLAG